MPRPYCGTQSEEARHHEKTKGEMRGRISAVRPAALNNDGPYYFGDVRVAALTLLTFTPLSAQPSCDVVSAKFSGQSVYGVCAYKISGSTLNRHLNGQVIKSY